MTVHLTDAERGKRSTSGAATARSACATHNGEGTVVSAANGYHVDELFCGTPQELLSLIDARYGPGSHQPAPEGGWYTLCPLEPTSEHYVHVTHRGSDACAFECSHGCDEEAISALYREIERELVGPPLEKLHWLDVAHMSREEPPPIEWLVEGLVVKGKLTLLFGREGEGKSLLAMAFARGVACGHGQAGIDCQAGRVLIVDAENGEHEIHRRVRNFELPPERVKVAEADGFDLRHDFDELASAVEWAQPDLLVLDSYRSLWGGEENDSGETSGVLDPLRRLGHRHDVGVLLLHHSEKLNGNYRGSSAIGASAELAFKLARKDGDNDRRRRYIETRKCRPAAEPPTRWLRLEVREGRVFVDDAEPFGADDDPPRPSGLPGELLDQLSSDAPLTVAAAARAVGRDPKDGSVRRALERLERDGLAARLDGGIVATQAGVPGCHPPYGGLGNPGGTLPAPPSARRSTLSAQGPVTDVRRGRARMSEIEEDTE